MRSPAKSIIVIATLIGVFAAQDLIAQEDSANPLFSSDWLIRGGMQRAEADVRVGLGNEELGAIPIIDFDRLGLDPKFTSGWIDITWQAPKRWSWGYNYFQSKADGRKVTGSDIEFGDLVIPAGTGFAANFETRFYILNGYYDFYQTPDRSAGVGFGVYSLDLEVSMQAVVAGDPGQRSESADILAPLPTFSLYYKHAFNE